MPHLFISYAKKDTRKLATDLADALNAVPGYTAWVDRSLKAGPAWDVQIQKEIVRCDVFVILYTPDINRHLNGERDSFVLNEIECASDNNKPIIPVMAQQTMPPLTLARSQYIDFTIGGLTVAALVEALCDEIGQPVPTAPPMTTKRPSSIELLPVPFAWVETPAGRVTPEEGGYLDKPTTFDVPSFGIGKYPVTNTQYALFVEAGGYGERKWWTYAGWEQRTSDSWAEPPLRLPLQIPLWPQAHLRGVPSCLLSVGF